MLARGKVATDPQALFEALTEPTGARLEIAGSRPLHTIARDSGTDDASNT